MLTETPNRNELAGFLRTRRSRVQPADVGLAAGTRRRTPGLRREEVALLANIGVTWYTRLEQGMPINVSTPVLTGIARALQLTEPERRHLFVLAGHEPEAPAVQTERVSPLLERVLASLDPNPAVIRGRRFDVLAWNRAAVEVFGDYTQMSPKERNTLWRCFFRREQCRFFLPRWEDAAANLVAQFRPLAWRYRDQPEFIELLDELLAGSTEFRDLWSRHDVRTPTDGWKFLRHPRLGEMQLEYALLTVPDAPDMTLTTYTAAPGSREEQLLRTLLPAEPQERAAPRIPR